MVSPRERPRSARRRIAGERTRPSSAAAPTRPAAEPVDRPVERPVGEPPAGEPPAAPPLQRDLAAAHPAEELDERAGAPTHTPAESQPTTEPAGESTAGEPAAERPARSRSLPWVGTGADTDASGGPPNWVLRVLAGLLVAALALDGFVVWREIRHQQAEEEAARAMHSAMIQAPSVAEKAAEAVLSYRYDTIDRDVAEARRFLTSDYAPAYISSIKDVVAGPATETRSTVRAQVLASGVSEASGERADVLVFVNQTTTSAAEAPKTALNRVVLTMVPRDGTWKIDEIQAF